MSVNRHRPHVLVLPEDDANSAIALALQLELSQLAFRRMQILRPAGGWLRVLEVFASDHIAGMERHPTRLLILLIDFDNQPQRREEALARIPERLRAGFLCSAPGTNRKH